MRQQWRFMFMGVALAFVIAGCAAYRPGPVDPGIGIPSGWTRSGAAAAGVWPAPDWWHDFGSAELDRLIEQARAGNLDFAAAAARVVQAEAQARIAGAPLLPEVVLGAGARRAGQVGSGASSLFDLSLGASYEVDFWGANRAGLAAAQASLRASEFDRATVALTVTSGVAATYLQILSLRERTDIARLNLGIAERVLALVDARARYGAASALELAQQRAAVAAQRGAIPVLEQQEHEARAVLALLLGRAPQGFDVTPAQLTDIRIPAVTPGLPSELLMRRPDVRRAEMQLVAAQADVAVARAALFPSLRLTGSTGLQSTRVASLFDADPLYSLAAALTMPIFNSGRLAGARELAEARREELLQSYRSAIIAAFSDTEQALGAIDSITEQAGWQGQVVEQAGISLELAEKRYRAGAEDLLTVLDAQRTLYQARDQQAQLRLARLQAVITLFRVLGGGWSGEGAIDPPI